MIAVIRLFLVLLVLLPITLILLPVQYLLSVSGSSHAGKIPLFWHRLVIRLTGLRVILHGDIPSDRPMMIVANHLSWMDIPVLASIMELCFIAKQEVVTMPGAGVLAKLQRSVFVVREERRQSLEQAREIAGRLVRGDVMVLFAEGTTGSGNRVLEFKSSLLGAAQFAVNQGLAENICIQPVSIAYTKLHGIPLGRHWRREVAWPGDISLGSHAKSFLLKSAWDVDVTFHEPVLFDETSNRRKITKFTHQQVREGFAASNGMQTAVSIPEKRL